jgi:hypothetical protein
MKVDRPIFVLRLRPEKGIDPIRALRNVLKELLRRHGMKCTSVDQIGTKEEETNR